MLASDPDMGHSVGMEELDYVRTRLKAIGRSQWESVAAETGVSKKTIQRIAYDDESNPTVRNWLPLFKYFQQTEAA